MELLLYKNNSEYNRLNKVLTDEHNIEIFLKDDIDIMQMSVVLSVSKVIHNYAFIPAFDRYYFIEDITSLNNTDFKIDLKVDVLMSCQTDILKSSGLITYNMNAPKYYCNNLLQMDTFLSDNLFAAENFTDKGVNLITTFGRGS
jgi:hypothetical protein